MTDHGESQPRQAVVTAIKAYIASNFLFDIDSDERFDDTSNLFEAGIVDSYGLLELILHLEARFGVHIQESDLTSGRLASVAGITDVVVSRIPS